MKQTKPVKRPEDGFLYVELLIALAILSFVILSIVPMFVVATRQSASASDQSLVTTFAQDMAETLKSDNFETLADGSDSLQVASMAYARTWVIQNDTPYTGMKTITVTVVPEREAIHGKNRIAELNFVRMR